MREGYVCEREGARESWVPEEKTEFESCGWRAYEAERAEEVGKRRSASLTRRDGAIAAFGFACTIAGGVTGTGRTRAREAERRASIGLSDF